MEHGGYVARHNGTRSSALSIINLFMTKGKATLDIQHEMVDQHMMLKDTAAGQELMRRYKMLSAKKNPEITTLSVNIKQLVAAKEKEFQKGLAEVERQLEMEQVLYNAERKTLRTTILSHRYLHQVVSRGVVGTSPAAAAAAAAAACVVM